MPTTGGQPQTVAATPAPVMPARPTTPAQTIGQATPSPAQPAESSLLDERRARKRTSPVKVVLLVLFTLFAIYATIGNVAGLSIWSSVSEDRQQADAERQLAIDTAQRQLARNGVAADESDFDVKFFDDGCIVSGVGYSKRRGSVRFEVSIAIDRLEDAVRWTVETVAINGEVVVVRQQD
jgi:hypothetical protein